MRSAECGLPRRSPQAKAEVRPAQGRSAKSSFHTMFAALESWNLHVRDDEDRSAGKCTLIRILFLLHRATHPGILRPFDRNTV
jgi:hypothetical protein